jgi:hypothetical protein
MTEEMQTEEDKARQELIEYLDEFVMVFPTQRAILALLTVAGRVAMEAVAEAAAAGDSGASFGRAFSLIADATAYVWMEIDPEKHLRPFN